MRKLGGPASGHAHSAIAARPRQTVAQERARFTAPDEQHDDQRGDEHVPGTAPASNRAQPAPRADGDFSRVPVHRGAATATPTAAVADALSTRAFAAASRASFATDLVAAPVHPIGPRAAMAGARPAVGPGEAGDIEPDRKREIELRASSRSQALGYPDPPPDPPGILFHGVAHTIQPSRAIRSDDPLEREADRVADQVLDRGPAPTPVTVTSLDAAPPVQRSASDDAEPEFVFSSATASGATGSPDVELEDPAPAIQPMRSSGASAAPAPADFGTRLAALGGASSMAPDVEVFFGQRFGHDFGNVRVHTGTAAAALATSIDARAFTVGPHIVFADGEYDPHTTEGQRLLAHELTHVLQQRRGKAVQRAPDQRPPRPSDEVLFHVPVSQKMTAAEFLVVATAWIFTISEARAIVLIREWQLSWKKGYDKDIDQRTVDVGNRATGMPESMYQAILAHLRKIPGGADGKTGTTGGEGKDVDYNSLPFDRRKEIRKVVDDWYHNVSQRPGQLDPTDPGGRVWQKLWKQKADQLSTDVTLFDSLPPDVKDVLQKIVKPDGGGIPLTDLRAALQLAEQIKKLTPEQLADLKGTADRVPVDLAPGGSLRGRPGGVPGGVIPFSPKAHLSLDPQPKQVHKYIKGANVKVRVVFEGPDPECTVVNYLPGRARFDWTILKNGEEFDSGPLFEGWGSIDYDFDVGDPGVYAISVDVDSPGRFENPTSLHLVETISVVEEMGRVNELFSERFVGTAKPFAVGPAEPGLPAGYRLNPGQEAETIETAILTAKAQIAFIDAMQQQGKLSSGEHDEYVKAFTELRDKLDEKQKAVGGKSPYVVKAVFLSRETSIDFNVSAYMFGERDGTTYRITLFDSTLGKVATHTGDASVSGKDATPEAWAAAERAAVLDMLQHWNKHNDYPNGKIQIGINLHEPRNAKGEASSVEVWVVETWNPGKTAQKALGYIAAAAGIILLAAAPFTGGTTAPVGIILLQGVAIGAALGALALKLYDRFEQGTLAADRELLLDLIGFVATVLGAVGTFGNLLKGASTLVKGMYFSTMLGLDIASGVLMAASVRDEVLHADAAYKVELERIDQMTATPEEKEEQRRKAKDAYDTVLARILASAALNGTFLLVSAVGNSRELAALHGEYVASARVRELLRTGSPEEIRAHLDSGKVLSEEERQLLELVYEGSSQGKAGFSPGPLPPRDAGLPRLDASDPLVQALPGGLRDRVPIYRDESIAGVAVVPVKENGAIVGVEVRVGGKGVAPKQIAEHLPEIQDALGYTGLSGRVRSLIDKARAAAGGKKAGTVDEARAEAAKELEKLPRIIEERLAEMRDGKLSPTEAADDILFLKEQMDYYADVLEHGGVPKGYIAAFAPAGARFSIKRYQRLAAERIGSETFPEGWTGEMEARLRGFGAAEAEYRWYLDKDTGTLRYDRLKTGGGTKRRTWDPEAIDPHTHQKGAFVDVDSTLVEATFVAGEGTKLAAGEIAFDRAPAGFDVKGKVQAAIEGEKGPFAVPTFDTVEQIVQFRAQKGQELATKSAAKDVLTERRAALTQQEEALKQRIGDLDKAFAERKTQLAELQNRKPPPEAKEVEASKVAVDEAGRAKADAETKLGETRQSNEATRKQEEALKEEMKPYYTLIVKISEQLAEVAAVIHVKSRFPDAELVFGGPGSTTQSGVFDQVWRVPGKGQNGNDLWIVVEAKGGASELGTKKVGSNEVQQGTREYFAAIADQMRRSRGDKAAAGAGAGLASASMDDILYLMVKAPYKVEGGTLKLGDAKVEQFKLGP